GEPGAGGRGPGRSAGRRLAAETRRTRRGRTPIPPVNSFPSAVSCTRWRPASGPSRARPLMHLEYVPLLRVQRELHGLPRNSERFRQYLRTILAKDGTVLELPSLLVMNPMGKDHVTALLDALLALDADAVAARAVSEAAARVADEPGDFKVALVVADDL